MGAQNSKGGVDQQKDCKASCNFLTEVVPDNSEHAFVAETLLQADQFLEEDDQNENEASRRRLLLLPCLPDIIFVGGGPIGLWTAIQLQLLQPFAKILVLEKHEEYQRKHTLRIDKNCLRPCVNNPLLEELRLKCPDVVRTNVLENNLLQLASAVGITIFVKEVSSIEELRKEYPFVKMIIGSDGAHSTVRRLIFEDNLESQRDLEYVAQLKYEVHGTAKKLNFITKQYPTFKFMNTFVQEYIGKEVDGITPVTANFIIESDEYHLIQQYNFKNPLKLKESKHQLSETLQHVITVWLNAKKKYTNEIRVDGSEVLTSLKLSTYKSKEAFIIKDNIAFLLTGDAYFGVPFFRSLNNGLVSGTELARRANEYFIQRDASPLVQYNTFMETFSKAQINLAKNKALLINIGLSSTDLCARTASFDLNYHSKATKKWLSDSDNLW